MTVYVDPLTRRWVIRAVRYRGINAWYAMAEWKHDGETYSAHADGWTEEEAIANVKKRISGCLILAQGGH